jgi:protein-arginine kinase activator protein McsA
VKRIEERIEKLKDMMYKAAKEMAYEQAAVFRDEMRVLENRLVEMLEESYVTTGAFKEEKGS